MPRADCTPASQYANPVPATVIALTAKSGSFRRNSVAIQSSEVMSLSMTTDTGSSWAETCAVPLKTPSTDRSMRHEANLLNIVPSPLLDAVVTQAVPRVSRNYHRRATCFGWSTPRLLDFSTPVTARLLAFRLL